jgi:hypothetical protein
MVDKSHIGKKVIYVGSMETLLSDLPDRENMERYINKETIFRISDIMEWQEYNIEIEYKSSKNEGHLFYVQPEDIEFS